MPIKNIVGERFGRLIVLCDTGDRSGDRSVIWLCKCDCGKKHKIENKI